MIWILFAFALFMPSMHADPFDSLFPILDNITHDMLSRHYTNTPIAPGSQCPTCNSTALLAYH
jgi:hypothetical protein